MSHVIRISAVHGGKDLDVKDYSRRDGDTVQLWDWHGTDNQKWRLDHVDRTTARIVNVHSSMVLDVDGGVALDLQHVVQKYRADSRRTQLWRVEDAGDGTFKIVSAASPADRPLVLDVLGWMTTNGAQLGVFAWHGGANQRFHTHAVS